VVDNLALVQRNRGFINLCKNLHLQQPTVLKYLQAFGHLLSEAELQIWISTRACSTLKYKIVRELLKQHLCVCLLDATKTICRDVKAIVLAYCIPNTLPGCNKNCGGLCACSTDWLLTPASHPIQ
jgi:hypothetical protein